ncbi:site-specific integrase [Paenibacillus rigui]|uniref:Integrase n=1 Tax=Paenibacillus rigui TaxID=554312 RepID=A0A229UJR3_9BACL|nr:site-specific integrase [Paenibacillus rigui]OXM83687.1 hypothetical protein CF651_24115 [Paenibacillus rigui]
MIDRRFVVKEYTLEKYVGGKRYAQRVAGIGIQILDTCIIHPLPITNFIRSIFGRGGISAQKNAAYEICKFLNYCWDMSSNGYDEFSNLVTRGISGLKKLHGSLFISELSTRSREGEIDGGYVRKIIRYLNKFYYWLNKEGLLYEPLQFKHVKKQIYYGRDNNNREVEVLEDIFNDGELNTIYPPEKNKRMKKLSDFGRNRIEILNEFLQFAKIEATDIYLGICLQFFGGLRRGEVVNLDKFSILQKPEGHYVDIDDRQNILFPGKKNTSSEQVKFPRYQALFWNTMLKIAVDEQLSRLDTFRKLGRLKNDRALFISSRTGDAITGSAYWYQFNRAKNAFLMHLCQSGRIALFESLSNIDWSTHLSRGVFTHFCFDVGMSVSEVAIARGDSSLDSLLSYIEERTVQETMADAMNKVKKFFEEASDGKITSRINDKQPLTWS